jgi:hypothetical protein
MSRAPIRNISAIVVFALSLSLFSIPMADARPLAAPPHAVAPTAWAAAWTSWLTRIFGMPAATRREVGGSSGTPSSPILHPNTGTCIDPNGKPIPCGQT